MTQMTLVCHYKKLIWPTIAVNDVMIFAGAIHARKPTHDEYKISKKLFLGLPYTHKISYKYTYALTFISRKRVFFIIPHSHSQIDLVSYW